MEPLVTPLTSSEPATMSTNRQNGGTLSFMSGRTQYMRVLNYSQILSALKRDKIKIGSIEYSLPENLKRFVSDNLPPASSMFIANQYLLVATEVDGVGTIVSFAPNGPPDPG